MIPEETNVDTNKNNFKSPDEISDKQSINKNEDVAMTIMHGVENSNVSTNESLNLNNELIVQNNDEMTEHSTSFKNADDISVVATENVHLNNELCLQKNDENRKSSTSLENSNDIPVTETVTPTEEKIEHMKSIAKESIMTNDPIEDLQNEVSIEDILPLESLQNTWFSFSSFVSSTANAMKNKSLDAINNDIVAMIQTTEDFLNSASNSIVEAIEENATKAVEVLESVSFYNC